MNNRGKNFLEDILFGMIVILCIIGIFVAILVLVGSLLIWDSTTGWYSLPLTIKIIWDIFAVILLAWALGQLVK